MKILLISDSHERNINLDFDKYDYIFHAGDYGRSRELLMKHNAIFVCGNCDMYGDDDNFITINDINFYITHGHIYKVKYQMGSLYLRAKEVGADIVIFGHTHKEFYDVYNNITFINPGAFNNYSYAEIIDNEIIFYKDKMVYKKFELEKKMI